jgi:hypothetical protein
MEQARKQNWVNYILIAVVLFLAILFVAKFGGPPLLRLYVESGIGSCQKIPILCMAPEQRIVDPGINEGYLAELLPYDFPQMQIRAPKGFTLINERIKKAYYKSRKRLDKGATIYLLYEEPNFFSKLFPQVSKQGIKDDFEFIRRTMYAKIKDIKNLNDVFFVVMKGIFIPGLERQNEVKMIEVIMPGRKGFINYVLSGQNNFFDCNMFDSKGAFLKIYIKDKGASLDLDKVIAIVSTANSIDSK